LLLTQQANTAKNKYKKLTYAVIADRTACRSTIG